MYPRVFKIILGSALLLLLVYSSALSLDRETLRWLRQDPPPAIDSIAVSGNEAIEASTIKSRMYSRTRNFWRSLKGDRRTRVQRETLERDTLEIKYLYFSRGFLGVQVSESFVKLEPEDSVSKAIVEVSIQEGRQYYVGRVVVNGSFDSSFAGAFNIITGRIKSGEPVDPFQLQRVTDTLKTVMANRGYPYATVQHQVDTTGNPRDCRVIYDVQSDSLVHFGEVDISGASHFPEGVARRELKIKPGNIYRRQDILDSQRRLYESGYYATFQLRRAEDSRNRLRPDFELRLRERKPRALTFKVGAGQSDNVDLQLDGSAAFAKRNLWGSRRFDVLADYALSVGSDTRLIDHRYRLRFTEPWFIGIRMPLTLTGELRPKLKDIEQDFDKSSWSVSATLSRWLSETIRAQIGFEYQSVDISGVDDDLIEELKQDEGISERRKLFMAIRRDSRNDIFVPSTGSVTELSGEYFGGFLNGDADFYKIRASWSRYQRVWPGWISATRVMGAWAREFAETEAVPLDEALYLGGAGTVRGFEENKLGPLQDDGTPLGNRYNVVVNQEFRWKTIQFLNWIPLIGGVFEEFPLWQSVFVDVGNGFATSEQIAERPEEEDLGIDFVAAAYGTGFQIMSPAGPIRIDYARAWDPRREAFVQRWHFTILYAF